MKKETESGEDEIKPKLRRKPTELDSDDDEDTVDDVKPLKQVCIEITDSFKFKCWKSYRVSFLTGAPLKFTSMGKS